MKKCKECGAKSKYGYHSLNCKVITSYWTEALERIKISGLPKSDKSADYRGFALEWNPTNREWK